MRPQTPAARRARESELSPAELCCSADSARARRSGWADAGWHRIDDHDPSQDVMTPVMNQLVKEGIEMDRQYVCASELPTIRLAV